MFQRDLEEGRLVSLDQALPGQEMELWMIRLSERADDGWAHDWSRLVAALGA
jgi:hypothetical protein